MRSSAMARSACSGGAGSSLADIRRHTGRHEPLLDLERGDVDPQRGQIAVAQRRICSRRATAAAGEQPWQQQRRSPGHHAGDDRGRARPRAESGNRNCRTRRSSRCRRPPPCGPDRLTGTPPGCRPAVRASSGSRRTERAPGRSPRLRYGTAGTAAVRATAHRPAAPRRSAWRRVWWRCASFPPAPRRPATDRCRRRRRSSPGPALRHASRRRVSSQARCTKQRSCSLVRK